MMNYEAKVEAYLTHYQPELKVELVQKGELATYLETQAASMEQIRTTLITQVQEKTPGLSLLQAEMEADRTVLEMFLTP